MGGWQKFRESELPLASGYNWEGYISFFASHFACKTWRIEVGKMLSLNQESFVIHEMQNNMKWEDSTQIILSFLNLMFFLQHHLLLKIIKPCLKIKMSNCFFCLFSSFSTCKFIVWNNTPFLLVFKKLPHKKWTYILL